MVQVSPRNSTVDAVSQKVLLVDRGRKSELLATTIKDQNWFQVLIFTRTKHGANRLAEYLCKHGVTALAIHGNKSQNARTRALSDFKSGELQALVATDIAARGLDIEQLPHVVNFDLPNVPEDYIHRIGRTGRAGATGEAVSLVCADDKPMLVEIERLIRREIACEIVTGFEPNPHERAEPIQRGGAGRGQARPARGQSSRGDRRDAPNRSARPAHPRKPQSKEQRTEPLPRQHAAKPAPTDRSTIAAKPARPAAPPARGAQAPQEHRHPAPRTSAASPAVDSTVRTNIPGLMHAGQRRGR
jgi:ATP-dependent RNA helicase RhlE